MVSRFAGWVALASLLGACSSKSTANANTNANTGGGGSGNGGAMGSGGFTSTSGGTGASAGHGAAGAPTGLAPLPAGSPSVRVGWYTAGWTRSDSSSDAHLQSLEDVGVNFLVTNQPPTEDNDAGFQGLTAYLDRAASHGIKVVVGIPLDALTDTDTQLGKLRSFAQAVKGHSGLWGYNVDEPDGGSVSAAQMANAYGVLKAVDPDHPLENKLLNSGYAPYCDFAGHASAYAPYMDLGGRDVYPIGPNDNPTNYNYYPLNPPSDEFTIAVPKTPHGTGGAFLATLIADDCANTAKAQGKLPPILDLQGVGTAAGYRDPTYLETRYMLFTTIIRDVSGVAFWVDYRAAGTPVETTVNSVIQETRVVGPYLKAGTFTDPTFAGSEPKVGFRAARVGKTALIVGVNESEKNDQPLSGTLPAPPPTFPSVKFTLPQGVTATSIDVVLDGKTTLNGGYVARTLVPTVNAQGRSEFTDEFKPYAVHIYSVHLQ